MKIPQRPSNERERLEALREHAILDSDPEPSFDALVQLAAHIAEAPIALVSLVDENRQWFKAQVGLDVRQTNRDISFCGHAVASGEELIVEAADEDERFFDNPLVTGDPHIRFYAGFPLRSSDGFVLGTLCVIDRRPRSLTEQPLDHLRLLARQTSAQLELRRANRELKNALDRLRTVNREMFLAKSLVEASHNPLIGLDLNAVVTSWNRAAEELLGYSAEEMIGEKLELVVPEEKLAETRDIAIKIGRGQSVTDFETKRRTRNGELIDVAITAAPIRDEDGEPIGIVGEYRDIRESKKLERSLRQRSRELEASNRNLEAFNYAASHDLRAPLRQVIGFINQAEARADEGFDETNLRYLSIARKASKRAEDIIDGLLALSHGDRRPLKTRPFNFELLVQAAWRNLSAAREGRSVEFEIGAMPTLEGDRVLLRQVFANLLSNALKFTRGRDPARISVRAEQREDDCLFCVEDNGAGFDPKGSEDLFQAFKRLHKPEEFEGSGIGLATVRRIVERHGGRVWAEGRPDEGARMFFSLPLVFKDED